MLAVAPLYVSDDIVATRIEARTEFGSAFHVIDSSAIREGPPTGLQPAALHGTYIQVTAFGASLSLVKSSEQHS